MLGRSAAALLGTLPLACAFTLLVAALPTAAQYRALLGFLLPLPSWVAAMCLVVLLRSATRAWLVCAAGTLAFGAAAAVLLGYW